jgi:hypothetical protein
MASDKDKKEPSKFKKRLRQGLIVLVIGLIVTIGVDGYFNRWDATLSLLYWKSLELHGNDGSARRLGASDGITVVRITEASRLAQHDSLLAFDQPYETAGFYRLYFRRSDSLSSTVSALYSELSLYDTSHLIDKTIFNSENAYRSVLRFVGQDTTRDAGAYVAPVVDSIRAKSLRPALSDSIHVGELWSGTTSDVAEGATKLIGRSPTAIIGIGLGIVAAAGLDLLKGEVYIAYAITDVFRLSEMSIGPRSGRWEGKDIDVLWVAAPKGPTEAVRDSTAVVVKSDSLLPTISVDTTTRSDTVAVGDTSAVGAGK